MNRSSMVLSRISICSIEAPIKKTRGTQWTLQKTTENVPFLFWGGLQAMFSIVGDLAGLEAWMMLIGGLLVVEC